MTQKIDAASLQENTFVYIAGNVNYSRVATLIEGAELDMRNQQNIQFNLSPITRPYTTLTIEDPQVIYGKPDEPTTEEMYLDQKCYASKKNPGARRFRIDDKSNQVPPVFLLDPSGHGRQIALDGELASGVPVLLELRIYKPKNWQKRGLAINRIIIREGELRYYQSNDQDTAVRRNLGITLDPIKPTQPSPQALANAAAMQNQNQDTGYNPQTQQAPQQYAPVQQMPNTQMVGGYPVPSMNTQPQPGWNQPAQDLNQPGQFMSQPPQTPAQQQQEPQQLQQLPQQAPFDPVETEAERAERLQRELDELRRAQVSSDQGQSAFDQTENPWTEDTGITYQAED